MHPMKRTPKKYDWIGEWFLTEFPCGCDDVTDDAIVQAANILRAGKRAS
jgi:hypothetical protein